MMDGQIGGLITHEAITLTYYCCKCLEEGFLVMEYGMDGKEWWLGQYSKYSLSISDYCNA